MVLGRCCRAAAAPATQPRKRLQRWGAGRVPSGGVRSEARFRESLL